MLPAKPGMCVFVTLQHISRFETSPSIGRRGPGMITLISLAIVVTAESVAGAHFVAHPPHGRSGGCLAIPMRGGDTPENGEYAIEIYRSPPIKRDDVKKLQ